MKRRLLILALLVVFPIASTSTEPDESDLSIEEVEASLEESLGRVEDDTPSSSVTANLIRLLVKRGVISERDAVGLIRQAEEEAQIARAQREAVEEAAAQVQAAAEQERRLAESETIRVTYVPDNVKGEIAEDVRAEVLRETLDEEVVRKKELPDWLDTFDFFGDIRLRAEYIRYPQGNDSSGSFPDFNKINTGDPFDVTGFVFSPQYNTDEDRERYRLRVRMGMEADLANGFLFGARIATGSGDSPVSTNQTMGSPGNFSKYNIWLDRGFLQWQGGEDPDRMVSVVGGRFDNPFYHTPILWDNDIGLDGIALSGRYEVIDGVVPFFTAGVFPYFNTSLNYPSNFPSKFPSDDRYIYAVQVGSEVRPHDKIEIKGAAAYYDFQKSNGKLSEPYVPFTPDDPGSTDSRRPAFAQKGNTYMALRDILPVPFNDFGTINQWQYFGLATPYKVLSVSGEVVFNFFEPVQIKAYGEYGYNLAHDSDDIDDIAVNNRGADPVDGNFGQYSGGANAWLAGLEVGHAKFEGPWDWRIGTNYRYVESDAVIDGFTDSDFGLGGTNVKGWTLEGDLSLTRNVWIGLNFMSSTQVTGPPFRVDLFQIDLSAKY